MKIGDMIDVLQAAMAGKEIQFRDRGGEWEDCAAMGPLWNFAGHDYRVKPKPREWWLHADNNGNPAGGVSPTPKTTCCKCVHVREVLP